MTYTSNRRAISNAHIYFPFISFHVVFPFVVLLFCCCCFWLSSECCVVRVGVDMCFVREWVIESYANISSAPVMRLCEWVWVGCVRDFSRTNCQCVADGFGRYWIMAAYGFHQKQWLTMGWFEWIHWNRSPSTLLIISW